MTSIGLLTYSTKPRGGVVHTLAVGEALQAQGIDVHVFALGPPSGSFFRETTLPFTLFPEATAAESLDEKVFESIGSMARGLADCASEFDLLHSQDCISARAATRVRDSGAGTTVIRTVHHIDDFTTQALIDCQRAAVVEPDRILVVSRMWQGIVHDEFGILADIVPNGVDVDRFGPTDVTLRRKLRATVGAANRPVIVSVGGIEPRKGTRDLFEALSLLHARGINAVLVLLGGHSFQDYRAYREAALAQLPQLGLEMGRDVVEVGTVDDETLAAWMGSADVLAMPSVKEGFGLVALEGLASGIPVVASSIPVFSEFLEDGVSALLPTVGDSSAIADALARALTDIPLRSRLQSGGAAVLPRFTWAESARRHIAVYQDCLQT